MSPRFFGLVRSLGPVVPGFAPLVFLGVLYLFRNGRDLTTIFLVGLAQFFCTAVVVTIVGYRRARPEWVNAGSLGMLASLLTFLLPGNSLHWIGASDATLTVVVTDADTGRPVTNATVRVLDGDGTTCSIGETGADGRLCLTHRFTAAGTTSSVCNTGCYYLWPETLQIDADGYQTARAPLEKHTGPFWRLHGPPVPVVEAKLHRKD
jgi:hypothetical protein